VIITTKEFFRSEELESSLKQFAEKIDIAILKRKDEVRRGKMRENEPVIVALGSLKKVDDVTALVALYRSAGWEGVTASKDKQWKIELWLSYLDRLNSKEKSEKKNKFLKD